MSNSNNIFFVKVCFRLSHADHVRLSAFREGFAGIRNAPMDAQPGRLVERSDQPLVFFPLFSLCVPNIHSKKTSCRPSG